MKRVDVKLGAVYRVKVSGKVTWIGTNLASKRQVRIRTAAKLRREVVSGSGTR